MRRSPLRSERPDANPARRGALSALCGLALAAGCASAPALPVAPVQPPPAPGDLRVELVFGKGADLDLYLTDPSQETVYFANTPSRASGGRLAADRRCDAPEPRIETVEFENAPPGRYRVGVDHAESCEGAGAAAQPFLVIVEADGRRSELRGEIPRGRFLSAVLEFTLPAWPAWRPRLRSPGAQRSAPGREARGALKDARRASVSLGAAAAATRQDQADEAESQERDRARLGNQVHRGIMEHQAPIREYGTGARENIVG
jgi:hypothetical protein